MFAWRLASRGLGFDPEPFQHARPAAIDRLAHLLAGLGTHSLELAMLELDARRVGAVGDESDLNLGVDNRVRLPFAVDVPGHDEAAGRFPHDDPADIGLRAILGNLEPVAANLRLHDGAFTPLLS